MTAFLWVVMASAVLTIFARSLHLSAAKYPRTIERKAWEDVVAVCESAGWVVWVAILLVTR
jgi:hypothetical protein